MSKFEIRLLRKGDIKLLMELERCKWSEEQLPSEEVLLKRIETYPDLSIGAFCRKTSKAIASAFLKPTCQSSYMQKPDWYTCAKVADHRSSDPFDALFGISLSSLDRNAVHAILAFICPRFLKAGYKIVYLGSPIPGFRKAKLQNPALTAQEYVQWKHPAKPSEPYDPQLNYYYRMGFQTIVSVVKDYFPHELSCDYGVIIKAPVYTIYSNNRAIYHVKHKLQEEMDKIKFGNFKNENANKKVLA